MKADELRSMTDAELHKKLRDLKEELFNLRFQKATGRLENPSRIRWVRREIARTRTVQREREIEHSRSSRLGEGA